MKPYQIEIEIQASKEQVWDVITDFQNYPNWNSVLQMETNDHLALHSKFNVTIIKPSGKRSSFTAKTIRVQELESFSATQTILRKWFFHAIHHFVIKEIDQNQVVFIQRWEFTGIIATIFYKAICKDLAVFTIMNTELKAFIEPS